MGRINPAEAQKETTMNHFSHPHPLQLLNYQPQPQTLSQIPSCSGCKLQVSGQVYGCSTCNFFLHKKCFEMPQKITHPFHKDHVLSLLAIPAYPDGLFNCDACGETGNGFSYHCKACNVDLHILCSVMPLSLSHGSHPHQLSLTFQCPYPTQTFSCDMCHSQGMNHWLYRCNLCQFDAHLKCAKSVLTPQPQQPSFTTSQYQTPLPQAHSQYVGTGPRSVPQPHTHRSHFMARPHMQPTTYMPQMQPNTFVPPIHPHNVPVGIPARPAVPGYDTNRQNNEMLLQMIQQIYSNSLQGNQNIMQAISMMGGGAGSFGADSGAQQFLQLLSMYCNGGGAGVPGFGVFGGGGGAGAGGVPGLDVFGGGSGGLDALQSLLGGGNGLDLLGGGGLDILGGLGGLFGAF